jgi:signal transduction histidine kinase
MLRTITFSLLLLASLFAPAAEPITRIAAVRALAPEVAARNLPVLIEATVTVYDPEVTTFFVHDGEAGIYISVAPAARPEPAPKTGDRIRLEGRTQPGDYSPNIRLERCTVLSSGPPLTPRKITGAELQEPAPDCDWVEFPAFIKASSVDRFGGLYFELLVDGWRMTAYVSRVEKFKTPPWDLLERKVRVQCAVGTRFNQQRQMCGRILTIPGLSFITPLDADSRKDLAPLRRSTELLLVTSPPRERARLRGVVTAVQSGTGFNLRDENGSVLVQTGQPLDFVVGDVVEAIGYAELAEFRPILNAIDARKLQTGPLPEPVPLDLSAPLNSRVQQELVSLDARLVEMLRAPGETTLFCVTPGGVKFEALYTGELASSLRAGSLLRVTGICSLGVSFTDRRGTRPADRFKLRLRNASDLAVLNTPSWWTAERIAWLTAAVTGVAGLIGLWAFLLRKQVQSQAAVIETQTKLTATLDERQRIARELHDTLEQDLMGVTLLLDDTAERLENGDAGEPLNIARRLLRRSREESRSTIRDLRSVALEQLGLPAAIEDTLQPIASAARLPLKFVTTGDARKLPTLVESSLLRIAHEALSNVVKHARADHAEIHLEYTPADVRLSITDHGAGFIPGEVDARAGHFGLQGIRERVNKIGGTLQIDSHPGTGTAIRITVPLS